MWTQTKPGEIRCPLTGETFTFDRYDRKAELAARAKADASAKAEKARREKIAGRPLTTRELLHGVEVHADPRSIGDRVRHDAVTWGSPKPDDSNPYRKVLDSGLYDQRKGVRANIRKKLEAQAEKWDRDHDAERASFSLSYDTRGTPAGSHKPTAIHLAAGFLSESFRRWPRKLSSNLALTCRKRYRR